MMIVLFCFNGCHNNNNNNTDVLFVINSIDQNHEEQHWTWTDSFEYELKYENTRTFWTYKNEWENIPPQVPKIFNEHWEDRSLMTQSNLAPYSLCSVSLDCHHLDFSTQNGLRLRLFLFFNNNFLLIFNYILNEEVTLEDNNNIGWWWWATKMTGTRTRTRIRWWLKEEEERRRLETKDSMTKVTNFFLACMCVCDANDKSMAVVAVK